MDGESYRGRKTRGGHERLAADGTKRREITEQTESEAVKV